MRILGLNRTWNVVIVGAGKLGSALAVYKGFEDRGFNVVGIMDVRLDRIGQPLVIWWLNPWRIWNNASMKRTLRLVVTVPAAAQEVADIMV